MRMDAKQFEQLVAQAVDQVPAAFRDQMENVAILVEDLPDAETLQAVDVDSPDELFGFYNGIPLTERTTNYGLVPPDKIIIYRQPILKACANDEKVRELVQRTVRHEIAHYFGIDDERLEEIDAY